MAQAEMDVVTTGLEQRYPGENRNRGATIVSFNEQYFGQVRPVLFILVGAVGLVLSIACTNLASLLLARGDARQRELAVRSALGAARARVARLVLVESVTVSLLGGLLGLLAAVWLIDLVVALSPVSLPSFVHVSVDARVLAFTFAVCTIAGVVFGLAPAVIGSRGDILQGLKLAGRGSATSGTPSLRRRLVTAQIALALVLAIGAGLMFRTLDRLRAFDPGFRLDGLLTVTISLPPDLLTGQTADKATPYLRALLDRVKTVRGVDSAGLTWDVPLIDVWLQTRVRIVDRDDDPVLVRRHMASPDYFRTLGIPLLEGRDFSARDDRSASQQVAIISRQFADRYWPNGGALHQRLQYNNRTLEIIGVVGDVQHEDLLRSSADPDLYMSVYQATLNRAITFAMRTSDSAEAIVAAIREIVRDIGLGAPIFATRTGEQIFNAQIARQRFMGALLTIFSSVALLVTLVGVYGVASYNVSRRTREIGVRMALGGARGDVLGNILRIELMPIAYGIVFGLVVATGASGALEAFLHEVSPTDPVTFATVAILVAAVALIACLLPARLATRIDPAAALRAE
jgi:predicted permease